MTQFANVFDIYRTGNIRPTNDPNSVRLFLDLVRLEGDPQNNINDAPPGIEVLLTAAQLSEQTMTILQRHFSSKYFPPSAWVWIPEELKLVLTFGLMMFTFQNHGEHWEFGLGLAGSSTEHVYVGSGLTKHGMLVRLRMSGLLEAYSYQNEYSPFGRTISANVTISEQKHPAPENAKKALIDVFSQGTRDIVVLTYLFEKEIRSYFYHIDHATDLPSLSFYKEVITPLARLVEGLYYVMMTDTDNEILSYGIGSKTIPMSTIQFSA